MASVSFFNLLTACFTTSNSDSFYYNILLALSRTAYISATFLFFGSIFLLTPEYVFIAIHHVQRSAAASALDFILSGLNSSFVNTFLSLCKRSSGILSLG
jgi:hypothetical protein